MSNVVSVSARVGMAFLTAVFSRSWRSAVLNLNGTSLYEMLRLMDQIDRRDLADMLAVAGGMATEVNLPRLLLAAEVVLKRKIPASVPSDCQSELPTLKTFISGRSPLLIPRDPTTTMPTPVPAQTPLTAADYQNGATLLGVNAAAVQAVTDVESGGRTGFAPDGRPIVRYELHVFADRTKGVFTKTHPHLSNSYAAGRKYHNGSQANEWSMIYGATLLRGAREHAFASASFGMFQIMGFNYRAAGYTSIRAFVDDMFVSPARHLTAFLTICRTNGWQHYLAAKNWAGFAAHYNGPKYKDNAYDTNLAAAYHRHGGV